MGRLDPTVPETIKLCRGQSSLVMPYDANAQSNLPFVIHLQ